MLLLNGTGDLVTEDTEKAEAANVVFLQDSVRLALSSPKPPGLESKVSTRPALAGGAPGWGTFAQTD